MSIKKNLTTILIATLAAQAPLTVALADSTNSEIKEKQEQIKNIESEQSQNNQDIDSIQKKIDDLEASQKSLQKENKDLEKKSEALNNEISELTEDIKARDAGLRKQARSAQMDESAVNVISNLLNSKSIADGIMRVNAMSTLSAANKSAMERQQRDRENLKSKQKENQEAINKLWENQHQMELDAKQLDLEKARLTERELTLEAQKSGVEADVAKLEAAKAAVAAARSVATESKNQQNAFQTPVVSIPSYRPPVSSSGGANTYPVGQCTWGAKELAPWIGNYWGNANMWPSSAQAAGFRTGSAPVAGSVVCWRGAGGGYGHVAYVSEVRGDHSIQVLESNFYPPFNGGPIGNYRGWFDPYATGGGAPIYIYPN